MAVKLNKSDALERLNMTPIIDVVFNLLIFFLVASKFEQQERALEIVLPQASEAMPLTEKPAELFINIDPQGRFVIERDFLSEAQLLARLQQAAANNPGRQTVIIRGDERSPLRAATTVMNLCNRANIRDYRIATAEPEGK
jgi:biopolymer transport protein ExbD